MGAASEGVVYFGSVQEFLEQNLRILLPPPLFERIRLQRGVFLEVTTPLDAAQLHRIVFKKSPGFSAYQEGRCVDLMTEPAWIVHAREFVRSAVVEHADAPSDMWRAWFEADVRFHASSSGPRFVADIEFAKWLDFYEEMRYWLACTMNETGEAFIKDIVEAIEHDNGDLVALHRQMVHALGKQW